MDKGKLCPCGSSKEYTDCCAIAHNNILDVLTAEQLMRSRYSAYVMANSDYLNISHHSKTRPQSRSERRDTIKWAKRVKWEKLDVLYTYQGQENDEHGIVEFKAYFSEAGKSSLIHEKSTFEKENGHWVYKSAI